MALDMSAKAAGPIPLDVSFRVAPGELMAFVGHSGSGKTTILRSIAGLWTPTHANISVSGEPWLDTETGVDLPAHCRRVGIAITVAFDASEGGLFVKTAGNWLYHS